MMAICNSLILKGGNVAALLQTLNKLSATRNPLILLGGDVAAHQGCKACALTGLFTGRLCIDRWRLRRSAIRRLVALLQNRPENFSGLFAFRGRKMR